MARMPYYLEQLYKLRDTGVENVSAPMIARELSLNDVQVRKDLALVSSSGGRPKSGYQLDKLIYDMEGFLGYRTRKEAVLVGVGHLGKALLSFVGFAGFGINIAAGFDCKPELIGTEVNGKTVFDVSELETFCREQNIHIGIITAPAAFAQSICDAMTRAGVSAIWNFAPTYLTVPPGFFLQNENMAASLAMLCKHLDEHDKV